MRRMVAVLLLWAACVPVSHPCAGVVCGPGICGTLDGAAVCLCDSGFQAEGLTCVDPCASNPCAGWGRGARCVVIDGQRQCQCGPGSSASGGGCELIPVCAAQHSEGDAAEPDECAALALTISPGVPAPRTLSPRGDSDWFRIAVQTGHAYSFSTEGVSLILEVLAPDGTLVARDGRDSTHAEVIFVSSTFDSLLVHARGLAATDTGAYQARYDDLGPDDYVNSPLGAQRVPNGTGFTGRIQYPGDLDVAWVDLPARSVVQLALGDAGMGDFIIEVAQHDGGRHEFLPGQSALVTPRAVEHLVFTARARLPSSVSGFAMSVTTLAVDDYSDDPSSAMPLVMDGPALDGALEREHDVDVFSAPQVNNHLYNVRFDGSPGVLLSVTDGSGQLLTSNPPGPLVWLATQGQPVLLRVTGAAGQSYSVGIDDLLVDDHGNTLWAATAIALNTAIPGRLELFDDVDVFTFAAVPGHAVEISTASNLWLELYDDQGTLVSARASPLAQYVASSATLTLVVRRLDTYSPLSLIRYVLTVRDLGPEDHGDTLATATPATIGTSQPGQIGYPTDADVFAVSGQAGHVYRATLTGQSLCILWLTDAADTSLDSSQGRPLVFFVPSASPLFVRVTGPQGTYSLVIEDLGADDHANSVVGATALTLGTPGSGAIQFPRDLDCFTAPVVAQHFYLVTDTASAAYSDFTVSALDGSQSFTWWSMQASTHAGFFKAASPQAGMLIEGEFPVFPVPYTLVVTDVGPDDFGDTLADATPLIVDGAPIAGTLQVPFDVDAFSVNVLAGEVIALTCTTTQGTACGLSLLRPGGAATSPIPDGPSRQTGLGGNLPGVWMVGATGQATGSYTLVATHGSDDSTSPRSLSPGAPLSGTIDYAGDTDDFSLQLTQGSATAVTISGNIEAWLYSPTGAVEGTWYDASRSVIPLVTGTYRLEVRGRGSPVTTPYSLAIQ